MGTLPVQGNQAFLCKEEGIEQQTWFPSDRQHVCLLKQGLDIVEFKNDKYRVCAQWHSNSLFSVVNVECLFTLDLSSSICRNYCITL